MERMDEQRASNWVLMAGEVDRGLALGGGWMNGHFSVIQVNFVFY